MLVFGRSLWGRGLGGLVSDARTRLRLLGALSRLLLWPVRGRFLLRWRTVRLRRVLGGLGLGGPMLVMLVVLLQKLV